MNKSVKSWGVLIHLGMNQWHDHYMDKIKRAGLWAGIPDDEYLEHIRTQYHTADHVRFDEAVWKDVSESYAANGVNMIVLDLGEAIIYPSHPELAVKGSWPVEKLKAELKRLREMGFEVIPKLNFSTSHDEWLGEYHLMVSTKEYYKVCADVIRDVCEIFEKPRLFHVGLDEERVEHHACCLIAHARQGDLWFHDVDFIRQEVERNGSRAWMWIDHAAKEPEKNKIFERLSKNFLLAPWYYEANYEGENKSWFVKVLDDCVKNGYDILPSGSQCFFTENSMELLAAYVKKYHDGNKVLGFLSSPWLEMCAYFKPYLIKNGESVGRARKLYESK